MFVLYIIAAGIAFLGWGVHQKQWHFLISGYNMMSKEEQAKVDVSALAKMIAIMCYIIAVLLMVLALCIQFELWTLTWIVTALMIIVPIIFAIMAQKTTPAALQSAKASPRSKKITRIVTVVTLAGAAIFIYFSMQPTKFVVEEEAFVVKGMYGDTMPWSEMANLQQVDTLPAIAVRTNGSAVGSKLQGNFKFKNGDKAKLFVDQQVPVFITYTWNGETYYLNEPTIEQTEKLYSTLQQRIRP